MDEDRLREVAHELYGLSPEEFTGARTTAEKQARADGDRELAAAVKGLRRPAVAAWAVNLLGRRNRELLAQVVALGNALREAQAGLQGDELRELTRQRRRLVAAVTTETRSLAQAEGQRLSDSVARQVEETLQAAMADPAAATAVLSGLLAQPLSSTGVESLVGEALAVPLGEAAGPASEEAPVPGPPTLTVVRDDGRELREAEERAAEADGELRRARRSRDGQEKKRAKAEARLLQHEAELEELRRRVAEAEEATEAAASKLSRVEAALEDADEEVRAAQAAAEAAAAEVERLRSARPG